MDSYGTILAMMTRKLFPSASNQDIYTVADESLWEEREGVEYGLASINGSRIDPTFVLSAFPFMYASGKASKKGRIFKSVLSPHVLYYRTYCLSF